MIDLDVRQEIQQRGLPRKIRGQRFDPLSQFRYALLQFEAIRIRDRDAWRWNGLNIFECIFCRGRLSREQGQTGVSGNKEISVHEIEAEEHLHIWQSILQLPNGLQELLPICCQNPCGCSSPCL